MTPGSFVELYTTGVEKYEGIPQSFRLEQNYPNPFNPGTTISYALPHSGAVKLTVCNPLGQVAAELVNTYQTAGEHSVTFNASGLSSGVYFYRLSAGSMNIVRKMILMK